MNIPVIFSCDEKYVKFLATVIASTLLNSNEEDEFQFYVMDGGIGDEDKEKINTLKNIKYFSIYYIDIKKIGELNLLYVPPQYHFSKAAYCRFFIADYLNHLDKIIYLDVDLLVLSSLSPLFETDLEEYYLAACHQCRGVETEDILRLGTLGRRYFNSGVMLLNLKKWRNDNISGRLVETAQAIRDKILWVDQDVLNYFFETYLPLDHKWNCEGENYVTYPSPAIVHFQGGNKFEFESSFLLHEYISKTPYKSFSQEPAQCLDSKRPSFVKRALKNFLVSFLNFNSTTKAASLRLSTFVHANVERVPQNQPSKKSDLTQEFIQEALKLQFADGKVKNGPFKGMYYPYFESVCSTIFPKLLGSYEKEISPLIYECIQEQPEIIIDVGCAEGYYAIGLALACPNSRIYAFDSDPRARELCKLMAQENRVQDRVAIREGCSHWQEISSLLGKGRSLIVCDVEGFEKKILTQNAFSQMKRSKFIIEIHDCFDIYISDYIRRACKNTHEITLVRAISDRDKAIEYNYTELDGYDLMSRSVLLAEERPESMKWFYVVPKEKDAV